MLEYENTRPSHFDTLIVHSHFDTLIGKKTGVVVLVVVRILNLLKSIQSQDNETFE